MHPIVEIPYIIPTRTAMISKVVVINFILDGDKNTIIHKTGYTRFLLAIRRIGNENHTQIQLCSGPMAEENSQWAS